MSTWFAGISDLCKRRMNIKDIEDLGQGSSFDVVVIGAGCIGALISRELSKLSGLKILIVESETDVAQGASKANSGIVHGGYDARGHWKGRLEREGNEMFEQVCKELSVPFKRVGSLVLSFTERDDLELDKLMENGKKNGVKGLEFWDRERILQEEPHVSIGVRKALHCPTAGITNPYLYSIAACESAMDNGVELRLGTRVKSVTRDKTGFILKALSWETGVESTIRSKKVVNCAGVFADQFCEPGEFRIKPRRGEYVLLQKDQGHMAKRVLFQAPTVRWGKGVLVTPTVDGNLLLGPSAADIPERTNKQTSVQELAYVTWAARRSVPHLDTRLSLRSFAGIRAKSSTGDFVINEHDGFVNAAGIDSPGLTSSPAVAKYVRDLLNLPNEEKRDWIDTRIPYNVKSSCHARDELKFEHDEPSKNIICRCETVTQTTIEECLRRGITVRCTDSVKWRTRAGMGECGGARCRHLVAELVGKEISKEASDIPKEVIGQELHVRVPRAELGRL